MKSKWSIKRLSEVAEIQMGQSPKGSSYNISGEGVPLINGPVEFGETPFSLTKRTKFTTEPIKMCRAGDLILCVRGSTTGRMNIAGYDSCIGRGVASIRSEKYQDWINFFIHVNRESIYRLGSGATFPNVSGSMLAKLEIPIPPESEQKRIVAIMHEAFEGIDRAIRNTEKNLANSRELFESYLNAIFTQKGDGWVEKKLGSVCKVKDGTHFSPKNSEDGKYMYITAKNIKPYYIDLTKITFISEEDHQTIYSRCPVKKGDVLYIKDGATAGIAAINNFEEEFSLLSSVAVFKTSSEILNTYLVHYANSNLGRNNFLGYIDGAAITRLTLTKLNNVFIPVPPLSEQQAIVKKLDELAAETQRLETIYRQKIAALKELKQSILQKAFTGELTADTPKAAKEEIAA